MSAPVRNSGGPTLLEFKIERLKPHTSDDDHLRYRTPEDLGLSMRRDPLLKFRSYLTEIGILTPDEEQRIQQDARAEVNQATDAAENAPWPDASTLHNHLYAA